VRSVNGHADIFRACALCPHFRFPPALNSLRAGLAIGLSGGVTINVPPEHLFINMGWDRCVLPPRGSRSLRTAVIWTRCRVSTGKQ
jgi:hypothetical protein